ncbi:MAG: Peptide deformylase [Deltaproteobacteria bacterium]|nr:Peptide deformylase [Deltaproteobacteria bacterium]
MPPILKILQTGEPVLRHQARPLTKHELASPRIQLLIELMRDTMRDAPGVGLAAPQIGESIQLVVVEDPARLQGNLTEEQLAARERTGVPFHVLVNPTLTIEGDEVVEAMEGCLSFDGYTMVVPRARKVRVEALDERGEPITITASGWYARILQHEIDHLHGMLCCDRMDSRTLMTVDNQARIWHDKTVNEIRAGLERLDS